MSFKLTALIGAGFGAVGPILWWLAFRAGRRTYGRNTLFKKLFPITPCIVLALGFPQGHRAYPRDKDIFWTVLIANMSLFAALAIVIRFVWRLVA